ncbi:hypothetical protein MAL08_15990 [Leptospira noguchii]|nr:hypothetical protein [Leptospira noguchii]UOG37517.1 hypothetical protein MAL08_15990 [Leptospira noguchii]
MKVFGLILVLIFNPVVCIGTGHRGVVTNLGSVSDRILSEGINFVTPIMVEMERIKKWNGKYPDTYLGNGLNTLFQLK